MQLTVARLIGAILITCGVIGLAYGGYVYFYDVPVIQDGPALQRNENLGTPVWISLILLALGGVSFLLFNTTRR